MIVILAEWWTDLLLNPNGLHVCLTCSLLFRSEEWESEQDRELTPLGRKTDSSRFSFIVRTWWGSFPKGAFSLLFASVQNASRAQRHASAAFSRVKTSTLRPRSEGGRFADIAKVSPALILFDFIHAKGHRWFSKWRRRWLGRVLEAVVEPGKTSVTLDALVTGVAPLVTGVPGSSWKNHSSHHVFPEDISKVPQVFPTNSPRFWAQSLSWDNRNSGHLMSFLFPW